VLTPLLLLLLPSLLVLLLLLPSLLVLVLLLLLLPSLLLLLPLPSLLVLLPLPLPLPPPMLVQEVGHAVSTKVALSRQLANAELSTHPHQLSKSVQFRQIQGY
jgi:hypothetical protein